MTIFGYLVAIIYFGIVPLLTLTGYLMNIVFAT